MTLFGNGASNETKESTMETLFIDNVYITLRDIKDPAVCAYNLNPIRYALPKGSEFSDKTLRKITKRILCDISIDWAGFWRGLADTESRKLREALILRRVHSIVDKGRVISHYIDFEMDGNGSHSFGYAVDDALLTITICCKK